MVSPNQACPTAWIIQPEPGEHESRHLQGVQPEVSGKDLNGMSTTVIDIKKVWRAEFRYKNQLGQVVRKKPRKPTVHCLTFDVDAKVVQGHGECMLSFAKRMRLLDVWTPVITLFRTAYDNQTFTGDKAKKLWKEFNRRQFANKKLEKKAN